MNKLNSRVKRLERVQGSGNVPIVINWDNGKSVSINQNGKHEEVSLDVWEVIKDEFEGALVLEVEWVE